MERFLKCMMNSPAFLHKWTFFEERETMTPPFFCSTMPNLGAVQQDLSLLVFAPLTSWSYACTFSSFTMRLVSSCARVLVWSLRDRKETVIFFVCLQRWKHTPLCETDSIQTSRSEVKSPLFMLFRVTPIPRLWCGAQCWSTKKKEPSLGLLWIWCQYTEKCVPSLEVLQDQQCWWDVHVWACHFGQTHHKHEEPPKVVAPEVIPARLKQGGITGQRKGIKEAKGVAQKAIKSNDLGQSLSRKYDTKSSRYLMITHRLAISIGSTNIPNSLAENVEFQSLLETLDPRYTVPGQTHIRREIDQVLLAMKTIIPMFLSEVHKISLCSDIQTRKGMSSSYLGVTAHFFHLVRSQASPCDTGCEKNISST